jgi:hypothetical protein
LPWELFLYLGLLPIPGFMVARLPVRGADAHAAVSVDRAFYLLFYFWLHHPVSVCLAQLACIGTFYRFWLCCSCDDRCSLSVCSQQLLLPPPPSLPDGMYKRLIAGPLMQP